MAQYAQNATCANLTFDFSDKIVVVTGGGSGIGLAIANDFARAGATVVIAGRSQEKLDQALRTLPAGRVIAASADVGDPADVARLITGISERYGRLDIVVSNASVVVLGEIVDVSTRDWEALRQTNIDGFFYLAKATLPLLERSGAASSPSAASPASPAIGRRRCTTRARAPCRSSSVRSPSIGGAAGCGSTRWRRRSSRPSRSPP
jgi:NAD(P)-dependent dehydrogenase (short-subunit alcohol dehydrogenase family)